MEESINKKEIRKVSAEKKRTLRKVLNYGIFIVIIGGIIWYAASRPSIPETEIVSRNGIHWHPEITIFVNGVKQELPANLGVGPAGMAPIHIHEPNGVVHLEYPGKVLKKNISLSKFFQLWEKKFDSFGTLISMKVNGVENTELENYAMQDKDIIELRYQK